MSQTISTTGDRIALVALAILVAQQTGSATDLGLVLGAQAAALVTFLLIGGVWADRLPRQRIMLMTDLARGGLHAVLAVLVLVGRQELWMLIAIEVLFGAAEAFFRPAFSGIVPQTVPEDMIQAANAANSLAQTLAQFTGPAIAVVLVLTLGSAAAFATDAGTFVLSAALLTRVHPRPRGDLPNRAPLLVALRGGFREVRSRPWVWVTILVFTLHLVVAIAPYLVLGPSVAAQHYGGAPMWGWVIAAVGLGTLIGASAALRWRPRRPLATGLLAAVPFGGLLCLCAEGAPLPLVLLAAVVAGAGVSLFVIWWETALAERVPPEALSRVASIDWMGSYALLPLGYVAVGYLADRLGALLVMAVGGALAMALPLLALAPRPTRTLGQRDEHLAARRTRASASLAAHSGPS